MSKNTPLIALTLAWAATLAGPHAARADGEPTAAEEAFFKDKGLTRDDRKFLLEEGPAIEKYEKAKSLYVDYQKAMGRYAAIVQYDEGVMSMQMEQQGLQEQANALQMQINSAGTNNGRMQRYVNAQLAPLRQQQTQARAMIGQMNSQVQAARSKAAKPEERKAVTALVQKSRQDYLDSVRELNELVAPLLAKYHEFGLDKTVTDTLDQMRRRTTHNYKLGPSDKLVAASKLVPNVKKHTAAISTASKKKAKSKATAP